MLELRPLVENGIIKIIPQISEDTHNYGRGLITFLSDKLSDSIRKDKEYSFGYLKHIIDEYYNPPSSNDWRIITDFDSDTREDDLLSHISSIFPSEVIGVELLGANYVADSERAWSLLQRLLPVTGSQLTQNTHVNMRFGVLSRYLDLPGIGDLSPKDIVSLRLQEESFEEWRAAFRSVMRHFVQHPNASESFAREFQEVATDMLLPRARQLRDSIGSKRSFMGAARGALTRFSLAAAGAYVAGTALEHPEVALIGVAGSRGLVELWEIAKTLRPQPDRVLLKHYSLLTPVKPI